MFNIINTYIRNKRSESDEADRFLRNPKDFLDHISHDNGLDLIKTLNGEQIWRYATVIKDIIIKNALETFQDEAPPHRPGQTSDISVNEFIDGLNAFRSNVSNILQTPTHSPTPQEPDEEIGPRSPQAGPSTRHPERSAGQRTSQFDETFRNIAGPSNRRPDTIVTSPQPQTVSDINSGLIQVPEEWTIDEYMKAIQNSGRDFDKTPQRTTEVSLKPTTDRREIRPADVRGIQNECRKESRALAMEVEFPDIAPDDEALADLKSLFQECREERKAKQKRMTRLLDWSTLSEPEVTYPIVQNRKEIALKITNNNKIHSYPNREYHRLDLDKFKQALTINLWIDDNNTLRPQIQPAVANQSSHVPTLPNSNQPSRSQTPSILENLISNEPQLPLKLNEFPEEIHDFVGPLLEESAALRDSGARQPNRRPFTPSSTGSRKRKQPRSRESADFANDVDLAVAPAAQAVRIPEIRVEEASPNENVAREIDGSGAMNYAQHYNEWKEVVKDKGLVEKKAHTAYLVDLKKSEDTGHHVEMVLKAISNKTHVPIKEVLPPNIEEDGCRPTNCSTSRISNKEDDFNGSRC